MANSAANNCGRCNARSSGSGGGSTGLFMPQAQTRAEWPTSKLHSFRAMLAQAREVDRRRVEIAMRIAEMEAGL